MTTLSISDLSVASELDSVALGGIRGGCGFCVPGWGMPKFYGQQPDLYADQPKMNFDAAQSMSQGQGTTVNNGNNAAFVGMPSLAAAPRAL